VDKPNSNLTGTGVVVVIVVVDKVSDIKGNYAVIDEEEFEGAAAATAVTIVVVDKVSDVKGQDVVVVDALANPKIDKDE